MNIKDMKILVIGAAVTGIPLVKQLCNMGASVILNDKKTASVLNDILTSFEGMKVRFVGGGHPAELAEYADIVVTSPGVPMNISAVNRALELGKEVISEIELSYRLTDTPIACITGTNGKTTTTALLGEIMKASGRKTFVTGNIGHTMICDVNKASKEDIFVLEASSFQLECTKYFRPKISAILNITPDHLDRHKTMKNYIDAKCKSFTMQQEEDITILNKDNDITYKLGSRVNGKVLYFSRKESLAEGAYIENDSIVIKVEGVKDAIINIDEIFLPGNHNLENALAATLIAYCLKVPSTVIANTLREFKGVEHRIEMVEEINGVIYYNDSKGTNTDSSIKAIEAMTRPTILIAGGYDKGSDFEDFVNAFGDTVKALVLIGKTAEKIEKTAHKMGFDNIYKADSLELAVRRCYELADAGDCVLLSPACASWDMFKNYEERGNVFKNIVRDIRGAD